MPVTAPPDISGHYSRGNLLARLEASLREDGVDPAHPTFESLAPYDHFHGRGLEATEDMANRLQIARTDHVLDVGSGLGGPARYMARRFLKFSAERCGNEAPTRTRACFPFNGSALLPEARS